MAINLDRKKQFGIKKETTKGTKVSLSASDYGLQLTSITVKGEPERLPNNVYKDTLDASPTRNGKEKGTITIGGEFKNSGTLNTLPKVAAVLAAARMPSAAVKGLAFTSATGTLAPLADVITGGTSGAKMKPVKIEGTKVYGVIISGTFSAAEALTASPSGWAATAGATDATATGFLCAAVSDAASEETYTLMVNEDGTGFPLYGAASTFSIDLNTGAVPTFTATFSGITDGANWGVTTAEVTGITMESNTPVVVANANLSIDGSAMELSQRVTVDAGNTVTMIEDLNSATWLKYATASGRDTKGTMEMVKADVLSAYGAYQKFRTGAIGALTFSLGSGAGSQIDVIIPYIQYSGIGTSNKDGNILMTLEFNATDGAKAKDCAFGIWFR